MKQNKIRIAIQSKGKLKEDSLNFLKSCNFSLNKTNERSLIVSSSNSNIEVLYVRHKDIPKYVQSGIADFGIIGENLLYENNFKVKIVKKLGFGKCNLVIAVPRDSNIKNVEELENERIATSYPNTLKKFLKREKISASLIKIEGSVEIATSLKIADAIFDISQTGQSFKDNNLIPIKTVLKSEAVIIQNPSVSNVKKEIFLKK